MEKGVQIVDQSILKDMFRILLLVKYLKILLESTLVKNVSTSKMMDRMYYFLNSRSST